MVPMVNKRLYKLVLKVYNEYDDTPEERSYTYSNLESAVYNGLRTVLEKYIKVNALNYDTFRDYYERTYDECIDTNTFTVSLGVDNGDEYFLEASIIDTKEIIDDEFCEDFLENFVKIKEE